jgi:hypothetical protein
MNPSLRSSRAFSSIDGNDFIFMARTSPHAERWQPRGEMVRDLATAGLLTILDDIPVVCAASVSTPALLYSKSIYQYYQKPVIRLRCLTGRGNYRDMLNAVYWAMDKDMLLPSGSCDPEEGLYVGKCPLLTAMILGETRQEVLKNESELALMGPDI